MERDLCQYMPSSHSRYECKASAWISAMKIDRYTGRATAMEGATPESFVLDSGGLLKRTNAQPGVWIKSGVCSSAE
jgi:hypothetical protein